MDAHAKGPDDGPALGALHAHPQSADGAGMIPTSKPRKKPLPISPSPSAKALLRRTPLGEGRLSEKVTDRQVIPGVA